MSSDYIPRLRQELLRAGAQKPVRWRPARVARGIRPIAVVALATVTALVAGAVLLSGAWPGPPVDQASRALDVTYRVEPATAGQAQRTAGMLRSRLAAADIEDVSVSLPSAGHVRITGPAGMRDDVAQLVRAGRLAFYDWEDSVLGVDASATAMSSGDPLAHGVTEREAKARAAAAGPDGRIVRDARTEAWFAVAGAPALTHAEVASARTTLAGGSEPAVELRFTARGETAFTELTRELARRGNARARDGVGGIEAYQHFAVVLDDRILAMPYIDDLSSPEGLDGAAGTRIQGGLTEQSARSIAAILSTGPLPAALTDPKVAEDE